MRCTPNFRLSMKIMRWLKPFACTQKNCNVLNYLNRFHLRYVPMDKNRYAHHLFKLNQEWHRCTKSPNGRPTRMSSLCFEVFPSFSVVSLTDLSKCAVRVRCDSPFQLKLKQYCSHCAPQSHYVYSNLKRTLKNNQVTWQSTRKKMRHTAHSDTHMALSCLLSEMNHTHLHSNKWYICSGKRCPCVCDWKRTENNKIPNIFDGSTQTFIQCRTATKQLMICFFCWIEKHQK